MVLMLESELKVWGRSPVKELNERSLQQTIDIINWPWIVTEAILAYFTLKIKQTKPPFLLMRKHGFLNYQKHMWNIV